MIRGLGPFIDLPLELLRRAAENEFLGHALPPIAQTIRFAKGEIDRAVAEGPEEYGQAVADDEIALIEKMLGVSFIICQVKVYEVIAAVKKCACEYGEAIPSLRPLAKETWRILAWDELCAECPRLTRVQVINAFANYYKHGHVWNASWTDLEDEQKRNAEVLLAVGARPFSTGVFRTGAEVLGNAQYDHTALFGEIVDSWASRVYETIRKERE